MGIDRRGVGRAAGIGRIFDWDAGSLAEATPVIDIVELSLPRG